MVGPLGRELAPLPSASYQTHTFQSHELAPLPWTAASYQTHTFQSHTRHTRSNHIPDTHVPISITGDILSILPARGAIANALGSAFSMIAALHEMQFAPRGGGVNESFTRGAFVHRRERYRVQPPRMVVLERSKPRQNPARVSGRVRETLGPAGGSRRSRAAR